MSEQKFIEVHVHMDAWDKRSRDYVEKGSVEQFWVMDTHWEGAKTPRHVHQDVILQAGRDMPEKIIPFAMIRWNEGAEQVEKYFEKGFVGLKAIVPPEPYNHSSYLPIYEAAERLKMPILFHTGIIAISPDGWKDYNERRGYGPANMQPAFLATIADLFPELVIIGGHAGYPYTEQTEHNLYYYKNCFHDTSGCLPVEWFLKAMGQRTCSYHEGLDFFHEKLLFATDHCIGNEDSEKWGAERRTALFLFLKYFGNRYSWFGELDNLWHKNADRIMSKVLKDQAVIR